jgi:hypothetical protein
MKPSVAVNIYDRDKTGPGARSAEQRFGKFARKTSGMVKDSGFGKLGKLVEGLTKFRRFGFDRAGLTAIGAMATGARDNVAGLTSGVLRFGEDGAGALGLGVAGYLLGEKWAKTGQEIGRSARTLGVQADWLQRARAANERYGVSADQTTASVDALGSVLYDAQSGANNLALGVMAKAGVQLKHTKDGAIDVAAAYDDIADAIARQKDPQVQKKLAALFGVSAALPALRQGARTLKVEGADFAGSGAELSAAEVARSAEVFRKATALKQHLGAIEKKAGMAAMNVTDIGADKGLEAMSGGGAALADVAASAKGLVRGGLEAGRRLVEGAQRAGREIGDEFERFVGRIEHRESGGHQAEFRKGHAGGVLTSAAGAMGAMQMLPGTAEKAAKLAGLPWDPALFRDPGARGKAYNEALGRAWLQHLMGRFDGDQVLAAAAYNAGEGRLTGFRHNGRFVPGWLQTIGDPRKGEVSDAEFAARIPFQETRDYVMATARPAAPPAAQAATQPPARAKVEIALTGAPPGTTASVTSDRGVDVDMHVAHSMLGP